MGKRIDLDRLKEYQTLTNGTIATVESSATASKAYAVGDRFYFKGKLYICTAAIASGGTITPNTNCKLDVLGDDITSQSKKIDAVGKISYGDSEYQGRNSVDDRMMATRLVENPSLDIIAFGNKTYRDIFVTDNMIQNGSFTDGSYSPAVLGSGSPIVTQESYSTKNYSLKCFGSSSAQISWNNLSITENHYYIFGCMIDVRRRSKGYCGLSFYESGSSPVANARLASTTNGFVTTISNAYKATETIQTARLYCGTMSSANADCYIDDVFMFDATELFSDLDLSDSVDANLASVRINEMLSTYISILNGEEISVKNLYTYIKPKFLSVVLGCTSENARMVATRYLLKIGEMKLLGLGTTFYEKKLASYASKAAVCVLPEMPSMYQNQGFETIYTIGGTTAEKAASITKVVTIITALPYITSIKNKYTIVADDLKTDDNVFQTGDVVTIEDLLYAMMLPSSNTAATALAHYVGKIILDDNTASESDCETAFLAEMAKVVAGIGCINSTFTTPSGLPDSQSNYSTSTCIDVLKIGIEASSWDVLNRIWNKDTYTINVTGTNARSINITTTVSSLILEDEYMILGGKTGSQTSVSPSVYNLLAITEPK